MMKLIACFFFTAGCLLAQAPDPMLTRVRGSYDVGEGIGYQDGFASLETFWGYNRTENFIGFLDAIGHVFDNGKVAANLGGGARFNIPSLSTLFGINGFYDYRRTNHFQYDQVGAGLEVLSKYFDIRANGYLPFGKKSHFIRNKFEGFVGNDIAYDEVTEEALRGLDGEVGFNLVNLGPFRFYTAGGVYYFERNGCITHLGGQGRLQMSAWQRFFAQVSITGDSLYKTRIEGQFALDVPLYSVKSRKPFNYPQLRRNLYTSVNSYLAQPVIRHPIIPVCKHQSRRLLSEEVVNPFTGGPYFFVHVKNSAPPGGNGSIEKPYNSLAAVEANEGPGTIIMFNPGNGTTQNNNQGVNLKFAQNLWGTGVEHVIDLSFQRRLLIIPAFTRGQNPAMTNIYGDGITLATATHVAGIDIKSPVGSGILGSNVTSIDLNRNTITNAGSNGIELNTSYAFSSNNIVIGNSITGTQTGVLIQGSDVSDATTTIARNSISSIFYGVQCLPVDSATINATITHNTISNFNQAGIATNAQDTSTLNPTIASNTITLNNPVIGIGCFSLGAPGPSIVNANISSNTVTGTNNAGLGIFITSNNGSAMTAIVNGNTTSKISQAISAESNDGTLELNYENNLAISGIISVANQPAGACCVRLLSNQASSYSMVANGAGLFDIESSTYNTSNPSQGVQQANQGTFNFTGIIDFVAPDTCNVGD